MPIEAFDWPVRVYWEDTDAGGVVYHASYLRFLERARTEWVRAQGVDQSELQQRTGIAFMVRSMQLDFLRAARLDDELSVSVSIQERRGASILFGQAVVRRSDEAVLIRAQVRVACVDLRSMRPVQIPGGLFS